MATNNCPTHCETYACLVEHNAKELKKDRAFDFYISHARRVTVQHSELRGQVRDIVDWIQHLSSR